MKKLSWTLALSASLLLGACSMSPNGDDSASKDSKKSNDDMKIGLSVSTLNNPFFVTLSDGAKKEAKKEHVNLTVVDAQDNASKQASDVEDLIQQDVDLIIINPTDSEAVASAVESANDAKIPVITVDRSSDGGKVVAHIASDNVKGGEMAGDYLKSLIGDGAKVAELEGVAGSSAARDRGEGFHKVADKGLDVVKKQTANFNRSEGLTVMENILQSNPDIKGVFAHNDEMALGALEAIEASGKKIKVVGFDATDDAVKAVKSGKLAATIAQQPTEIGEIAVETAVKSLKGEKVEKNIPVDLELIKK
ncbi:ribose ABC transporter substrate-binding protein RbsB [Rummeliibacillus sp. G93]|uniref:ribose ABC transporter substrate-binding protein RbsB n=1 Tax=Rummeliibacillus TaxID=648802 RepID=UPI001170F8C8|nr:MULTISPECIES: ribose ABC transporter substrate-binding protein RbsB [Rummeliibacillus]MBB5170260.1 ribose transport system substrate-binding protein [Rummeliibacillus stabekisii]UQW97962.1 ribose ABC transporter substrate-binding protein RbsB [Rummeliibacillus sp. G93]GEL04520.1 D-ribose ABC transporter substrate-binding protein [Rummeliibacillus stabekisii]